MGVLRSVGYEYSRTSNPTRTALEECLTALEGGIGALAFASGMAAEDCLLRTVCSPGDHVLIPDNVYRPSREMAERLLRGLGIAADYYDPMACGDVAAMIRPNTRLMWVEAPGSVVGFCPSGTTTRESKISPKNGAPPSPARFAR